MRRRPRLVVHAGPVVPAGGDGGARRTVTAGKREWALCAPGDGAEGVWTWHQAGLLERTWWLDSERGTVLVVHVQGALSRTMRAEAAAGGWTLQRAWTGRMTVRDDHDAVVLQYHPGWLGRGRIEPASGPDLHWRHRWLWRFALQSGEGRELLALARAPGFLSRRWLVTLSEPARERADLLPLAALAWRIVLSAARHHGH